MKNSNVFNLKSLLLVCLVFFAGILMYKKTLFNQVSVARQDDLLTVGMMSGWPPFMVVNQQGVYEGFDVDVAQQIAEKMGKRLEIKDFGSLAPLFVALEQGKIDLLMSGLGITENRLQKLAMVKYSGEDIKDFALVFWNKIPETINSIEDLKKYANVHVCVEPGSFMEKYLDRLSFIQQKPIANTAEMIMDIKYGKSFAALLEPAVVAMVMKKYPEIKKLDIQVPQEFQVFGSGIAIKKGNEKLVAQITKIIQGLRGKNILQGLEKKWNIQGE